MRRARFSERANHRDAEGGRGGSEGQRAVPAARDLGRDLLHLTQQVWWAGDLRDAAADTKLRMGYLKG